MIFGGDALAKNLDEIKKWGEQITTVEKVGVCPFVRMGDIVTLKADRAGRRKNVVIISFLFDSLSQGACGGLGQKLSLILASDNEQYHPGNDVEGVDCTMCPHKDALVEVSSPPKWALPSWEKFLNTERMGTCTKD
jgi:hypothetical protein